MPVRKKRRRDQPHKVLHLTTYKRLEEYLGAFARGHFHLLILVGAGGLAKSRSVRSVLDGKACWIEGNATPFSMYVKLYRHRDQFVVIDDVDALYADRKGGPNRDGPGSTRIRCVELTDWSGPSVLPTVQVSRAVECPLNIDGGSLATPMADS